VLVTGLAGGSPPSPRRTASPYRGGVRQTRRSASRPAGGRPRRRSEDEPVGGVAGGRDEVLQPSTRTRSFSAHSSSEGLSEAGMAVAAWTTTSTSSGTAVSSDVASRTSPRCGSPPRRSTRRSPRHRGRVRTHRGHGRRATRRFASRGRRWRRRRIPSSRAILRRHTPNRCCRNRSGGANSRPGVGAMKHVRFADDRGRSRGGTPPDVRRDGQRRFRRVRGGAQLERHRRPTEYPSTTSRATSRRSSGHPGDRPRPRKYELKPAGDGTFYAYLHDDLTDAVPDLWSVGDRSGGPSRCPR